MIIYKIMTERMPSPDYNHSLNPELVEYEDGSYAFVLNKPGTEVRFDAAARGLHDPAATSFDLTDHELGTLVALSCRDYDGNASIFVTGNGLGDLVCRLDVGADRTQTTVYEEPYFRELLADRPMMIGARHSRLGERKLTKVVAEPQMNTRGTVPKPGPQGKGNPLSVARRLFQQYLDHQQ